MSSSSKKVLAVVPARYGSTRFPGKMVAMLAGKPLVMHAYLRAKSASLVDEVLVATDDARIAEALAPYDIPVVMTRADHPSGSDRIAEVVESVEADVIVNVQGDEVLIDPATIDGVIQPLLDDPSIAMSTARHALTDPKEINDPNIVKVICNARGHAIYFSRSPIPYVRDGVPAGMTGAVHWQHVGLYAYQREFIQQYARMAQTPLEQLECLEQLRVLENGYTIAVADTVYRSVGVDTPEELEAARKLFENA